MAINLTKTGISVIVGAVDIGLERSDETAGRTEPFKKWADYGRVIGALAGYGLQVFMPRQAAIGEALALSATPLLVKSIYKAVVKPAAAGMAFTPRQRITVPASHGAAPSFAGIYRPIT